MGLAFLADENIDKHIVQLLRQKGYQITYISESAPGSPDDEVLRLANKDGSILMTSDKDFGELIFRQRQTTAGVILIRLHGKKSQEKADIVLGAVEEHADVLLGAFTVITEAGVRFRKTF